MQIDMDDREDGEVSGSDCDIDEKVYNPVARPVHPHPSHYRNVAKAVISSDEDDDSSDSDFASLPKRKKMNISKMEIERNGSSETWPIVAETRKKNNIWANVLQEEELTKEIGGVGLKKLNTERDVESYDYTQAYLLHNKPLPPDSEEDDVIETEPKDLLQDELKRMDRKRRFQDRMSDKRKPDKPFSMITESQRNLVDIVVDPTLTDEELGCILAEALHESKPELIVKVVEVVGQEIALKLYSATQEVEKNGGMMIFNGVRRRTSGGVFLQLLKKFDGVEKNHITQIFADDSKDNQWRKRKRMNRRRRHDSKSQVCCTDKVEEEGLQLQGLFSDDPGGTKCPGSTPVTTPQGSDEEGRCHSPINLIKMNGAHSLPLKEVCEKAALEIFHRDSSKQELRSDLQDLLPPPDEMDVV